MVWTAVCEKNGVTSAVCFQSPPDAKEALANIKSIVQCDGFFVMALLKGDQTKSFYGIDFATKGLNSEEM